MSRPLPKDFVLLQHDLDIAARTIAGEARGEPIEGQIAVAWVIRNRAETVFRAKTARHHYGPMPSLRAICLQPWAFSCWNAEDPNKAVIEGLTLTNQLYLRMLELVARVMAGDAPDPTNGATLYHALKAPPPRWNPAKLRETARIGRHTFYQELA